MASDLQTLPTLEKTPTLPSIGQNKTDMSQYKEPGYYGSIRKGMQYSGSGLIGNLVDFLLGVTTAAKSQAKRKEVEANSLPTIGVAQQGLPFLGRK